MRRRANAGKGGSALWTEVVNAAAAPVDFLEAHRDNTQGAPRLHPLESIPGVCLHKWPIDPVPGNGTR